MISAGKAAPQHWACDRFRAMDVIACEHNQAMSNKQ